MDIGIFINYYSDLVPCEVTLSDNTMLWAFGGIAAAGIGVYLLTKEHTMHLSASDFANPEIAPPPISCSNPLGISGYTTCGYQNTASWMTSDHKYQCDSFEGWIDLGESPECYMYPPG